MPRSTDAVTPAAASCATAALERDVLLERLAAGDEQARDGFGRETDAPNLDRDVAGGDAREREATVDAGLRTQRGADDLHADVGDPLSGRGVDDSADDSPAARGDLRRDVSRGAHRDDERGEEQRRHSRSA